MRAPSVTDNTKQRHVAIFKEKRILVQADINEILICFMDTSNVVNNNYANNRFIVIQNLQCYRTIPKQLKVHTALKPEWDW